MKKLFTLFALLAVFMGAKAEWVEDYKIDYSTYSGFPFYVMGYVPEWVDGVMTDMGSNFRYETQEVLDGDGDSKWKEGESSVGTVTTQNGTVYQKVTGAGPYWHQYFIANEIPTEIDGSYTVKAMVRASEACQVSVEMRWSWSENPVNATVSIGTEWQELEWEHSGVAGTSCSLIAKPGTSAAVIEWKYLTVSHNQKAVKPIKWVELLTNGDAETPWTEEQANTKFDDKENNYKICAWGKERERNMNENGGWDPFPCDIVELPEGGHAFIVRAKDAITEGDASAWDNQFWIQSTRQMKAGEQVKIHFRYKASQNAKTNTQIHHQNPSDYMHWQAIGDIDFTTEWQEYDKVVSWPSGGDDQGWSIAFNLNPEVKSATDFYFDDLSIAEMELEHGYFVAGANPADGLEYDFDNAVKFEFDSTLEYPCYTATIGDKNEPVSQVMISTVRGNDAAFKSATLKPIGDITNDPTDWHDYTEASLAKLNLPGSGKWKIYLDDEFKSMAFEMLEGTEIKPIEINPNPTVVVVNGLERDFIKDDDHPDGTGQPWDNQFFIVANRTLSAGEATVVQFKYKSSIPAKTTTQSHAAPGAYLHWAAIGDVNFTEDWQDFNTTFTVANEADGMQSIAFNMAEIKEACKYEIKDIVWKLEDGTESLINQEGSENFYVKEGAGTEPHVYTDPEGISNIVNTNTVPTVTYNLAGQRVNKAYKGIVIKNGKKVVVK